MIKTLDMQFIRYVNLFEKITNIRTNHCFEYNNAIVFAVPRIFVSKAIGKDNQNLTEECFGFDKPIAANSRSIMPISAHHRQP